jgi:hypothetical protein
MTDQKYLQKRKNTWYVVVEVPKALRGDEVPPRFVQSLQTSSLAEAGRLKHPVVAEFQSRVDRLRQSHNPRAVVMRDASEWREARDLARKEDGVDSDIFQTLTMQIQELTQRLSERDRELAQGFNRTALGKGTLIKDEYPLWLAECPDAEQTKVQHASTVKRFLDMGWGVRYGRGHQPQEARGEYVSELLTNSGLSRQDREAAPLLALVASGSLAQGEGQGER